MQQILKQTVEIHRHLMSGSNFAGQRTCYIADPEGNLIEIGSWNKVYEQKDL